MPSLDELKSAFLKADQAGNTEDAAAFAKAIKAQSTPLMQTQVGSPEAIAGLESAPASIGRTAGVAARPWGPLAAAMATGAAGGGALGIPGGPAGMLAGAGTGAGVGATAYAGAHLADLPIMAINGIGSLFGANPDIGYPGASFDEFVNKYNPLPQPESKGEKYLAAVSGGVKDAVAGNRAGVALKGIEATQQLRPVFQSVGNALSDAPVKNMALGGTSGAGAELGGELTDGSTSGKITGALAPVLGISALLGGGRGLVNAAGGPSSWRAYGKGFVGQGEGVSLANGETMPASFGFTGGRLENARQTAENQVQQQVKALAGNEAEQAAAASNLDSAGVVAGEGYQPTAGSLSMNPGLTMAENGLFQSNPSMRARYEGNQRAISGSVNNTLQPKGAAIPEAQGFISRLLSNTASSAERNAKNFEDIDMARAEGVLQNKRAAVTSNATADQQTAASTTARRQAGNMMANEEAAYRKLYDAVPRDTPIEFNNSIDSGLAALKEFGANSGADPSIGSAQARIKSIIENRVANPVTNFGELESDIKIVNSLIRQADNAGQDQAARLYLMLKDGLVADREAGGAANVALKEANNAFRTYSGRWKNGVAGDALDKNALPSETLDTYMSSPEGAQQFKGTIGATPQGQQAAGSYLAARVAKGAGQTPTKQSVTASINNNPAISTFPAVKAAEEAKASQIGAATKFQGKRAGKLGEMQTSAAEARTQATSSLPAKFSGGSEESAINSVEAAFGNKTDPVKAINELKTAAKLDKTGKSMEGLQNATRVWLGRKLFNNGNAAAKNEVRGITNEDLPTSMAKSADVLKESGDIFKNLKGVLPPEEIQSLQTNYRRLEMGTRIRKAGAGQSATSMNEADKGMVENLVKGYTNINAFRAIKTGKTMLQDLKTIAGSAFTNSKVNAIVDDIRLQAFLDPEKMKQLLLRPTPQNLKRTSWVRQQMNVLAQEINRKPEDDEKKTSPATPKAAPTPVQNAGQSSPTRKMRWNPAAGKLEASE